MFYGTYIGNNKMLVKTQWGIRLICPCEDMSLMPTLLVDGIIEQGLTNWIIKNQDEFKDKTVIDVGANIGYFTALFSAVGAKVIAYEANPDIFSFLEENIYLSQLHQNTTLINKAVSNSVGPVSFYKTKKYQGNSSLIEHTDAYMEQFATDYSDLIFVESVCLEIDLKDIEDVFLIKIDTEGAEWKVFMGMTELIAENKIKNIVFELNKNMMGAESDRLFKYLKSHEDTGKATFHLFKPDGDTIPVEIEDIFKNNYIDNILMKF